MHNPFQSPQAVDSDAALPEVGPPYVFEGDITINDWLRAADLAGGAGGISTYVTNCLLVLAGITLVLTSWNDWWKKGNVWDGIGVGGGLFMTLSMPLLYLFRRAFFARTRRLRREMYGVGKFKIDTAGVETVTEKLSQMVSWNTFTAFRSTNEILILYYRYPRSYVGLVRTQLTNPDAWPSLLRFLAERLPRK